MSVTVTHGGWLFGPQHEHHAGREYVMLHRLSLNTLLYKLEAFAEPKADTQPRGMERAVWAVLEQHRGKLVPPWRLRRVIQPCSIEARRSKLASIATLRVAVSHCRALHPGERIICVPERGYRLEVRPDAHA
jgi:hypothetical protein